MSALSTARLSLTPLAESDVPELHAHWIEPGVRRYLWDGRLVTLDEVHGAVRTSAALFRERGAGLWGVRRRGRAALIGCAGFWYFHEPPELELVLSLSEAEWGRGLGRESAAALLGYAFDALGWPFVQASADAPNEDSLKLLERLGMEPAGQRPGEFGTIEVFRMSRERWRPDAP